MQTGALCFKLQESITLSLDQLPRFTKKKQSPKSGTQLKSLSCNKHSDCTFSIVSMLSPSLASLTCFTAARCEIINTLLKDQDTADGTQVYRCHHCSFAVIPLDFRNNLIYWEQRTLFRMIELPVELSRDLSLVLSQLRTFYIHAAKSLVIPFSF